MEPLTKEQSKSHYDKIEHALMAFGRALDHESRLRINTKTTGELFIDLSACDVDGVIETIAHQAHEAGRKAGKSEVTFKLRELFGVA